MRFSNRLAALGGTLLLAGAAQANYQLETSYDSTNFFDSFDFFTGQDPTHGFVDYVDSATAKQNGLASYAKGGIYMGVDSKTVSPANGRQSVRLTSQKTFTHGLFIADIAHMPGSICGAWPAFWMFGPDWPSSGEIDIIEGVNTQTSNRVTLHANSGCQMSNQGSLASSKLESTDCGAFGASVGCAQSTANNQNYGDGFNDIGGGVYATEWTSDHIAVWFFPRSQIPQDIHSENPNPSNWGEATAKFNGGQSCNIDSNFKNNQIVFDTTFCGDWAGSPDVWGSNAECSALAPTCQDYVSAHPEAFAEAYWVVNSIKVYQQGGGDNGPQPSTSQPAATTSWPIYQPTSTTIPLLPTSLRTQPAAPSHTVPVSPPSWSQPVWNEKGFDSKAQAVSSSQAQPTTTITYSSQYEQPPNPAPAPAPAPAPIPQRQTENSYSQAGKAWNGQGWPIRRRSHSKRSLVAE